MIAAVSRPGNFAEIGCGIAPHFHTAIVAVTNSMPLGSPIVTNESRVTPSCR